MRYTPKTTLVLLLYAQLFGSVGIASERLEKADALLNQTYNHFMNSIETQALKLQLRDAQRVWIQYRDRVCKFEVDYYRQYNDVVGPSALARVKDDCLQRLTDKRTRDIRGFFTLSRTYNSAVRSRRMPSDAVEYRALTIDGGNGSAINIESKSDASGSYSITISPRNNIE